MRDAHGIMELMGQTELGHRIPWIAGLLEGWGESGALKEPVPPPLLSLIVVYCHVVKLQHKMRSVKLKNKELENHSKRGQRDLTTKNTKTRLTGAKNE
jgi:hypothetical protein